MYLPYSSRFTHQFRDAALKVVHMMVINQSSVKVGNLDLVASSKIAEFKQYALYTLINLSKRYFREN